MEKAEYLKKMEQYWNETGDYYSKSHELFLLPNGISNYKRCLEMINKKEGLNFHEVATGAGLLADYIVSEDQNKFSQLIFADIADFMVSSTQKRLAKHAVDTSRLDLQVIKSDCEELEKFPTSHFNVITANFVMQLIQNLDSVFRGIAHCLSDDGVFAISYFDKKETSTYHTNAMEIGKKYFTEMNKEKDVNFSLDDQLPAIIEKNGLYIAERSINNIIYDNEKADYNQLYNNYLMMLKEKYGMSDEQYQLMQKDIAETAKKIKDNNETINIQAINIFVKRKQG